ncbi:MAG: sigma 54-interacting transcriptional regulator [Planctomycetaceae bacterium]
MTSTLHGRSATIRPGGKLLVWSGDERSGLRLQQEAARGGFTAEYVANLTDARQRLTQGSFAVCILDEPSSLQTVRDLASAMQAVSRNVQFIVLPPLGARYADSDDIPECCDILRPPLSLERLAGALFRAAGRAEILVPEQAEEPTIKLAHNPADPLTGHSQSVRSLRDQVRQESEHRDPVLIQGPPGSGTNVAARSLHNIQFGTDLPYIVLRCGVLTGNAIEQELFGDPMSGEPGRWDAACGGTLVLDDVDAIPLTTQARILKLIVAAASRQGDANSEGRFRTARVVATTHVDLEEQVRDGRFDPELYRAIKGSRIEVPALSDRREDIVPLVEELLVEIAHREGLPLCRLGEGAVKLLQEQPWPENVRQLGNVLSRCVSLNTNCDITPDLLKPWLDNPGSDWVNLPGMTLREMERKLIEATFNRYGGNREMTAKALQIGLRTLSGKLRDYGYPPRGGPGSNQVIRRVA